MNALLIPIHNELPNLPALLKALPAALKGSSTRVIFIDNASSDGSAEWLKKRLPKNSTLLLEANIGFASSLNCGLSSLTSKEENIFFLDADAIPKPNWGFHLQKALETSDIVVGNTQSLGKAKSAAEKLAHALFNNHSLHAAYARSHALPWGPTCNLGVKAKWFDEVGPFSMQAGGAHDIDWCWRAVLAGASIAYEKNAVVAHTRRNTEAALFAQFGRYGQSEAWLQRTYAFLQEGEPLPSPLEASLAAFDRLQKAGKASALRQRLAVVFASAVRLGYEKNYVQCPMPRSLPKKSIGWVSGKNEVSIFVPGKGIATLEGPMAKLWQLHKQGVDRSYLVNFLSKALKCKQHEAEHQLKEFLEVV